MMQFSLFFVGLPLLLIFGAAFITMLWPRKDTFTSRFQEFFVLSAAYSMVVFALGFLVPNPGAGHGGSASAYARLTPRDRERNRIYGPETFLKPEGDSPREGPYYFYNSKRNEFTPVSKETFERALFFERLALCLIYMASVSWLFSILILVVTKRYFVIDAQAERLSQQKFTPQ